MSVEAAAKERRLLRLFAPAALLPSGWARDVTLDIDADGTIVRVDRDASCTGEE